MTRTIVSDLSIRSECFFQYVRHSLKTACRPVQRNAIQKATGVHHTKGNVQKEGVVRWTVNHSKFVNNTIF